MLYTPAKPSQRPTSHQISPGAAAFVVQHRQHTGDKAVNRRAFRHNVVIFHIIVEEILVEIFGGDGNCSDLVRWIGR